MQQSLEGLSREERDALAMRQIVMRTFCDLLHATRLPPMTVLEYAAAAVGSVYREVADVHTWPIPVLAAGNPTRSATSPRCRAR